MKSPCHSKSGSFNYFLHLNVGPSLVRDETKKLNAYSTFFTILGDRAKSEQSSKDETRKQIAYTLLRQCFFPRYYASSQIKHLQLFRYGPELHGFYWVLFLSHPIKPSWVRVLFGLYFVDADSIFTTR